MSMIEQKRAKAFENKIKRTIERYGLIDKDDKILVACSGGKDSTVLLYILHKLGYDVEALSIDLHLGEHSSQNMDNVRRFCKKHKIRLHLFDIKKMLGKGIIELDKESRGNRSGKGGRKSRKESSICMTCGIVKRWALNRKARELKATKLATGHNLNDESETVLMNLLKGNPEIGLNMGPMTGGHRNDKSSRGFVQRIKPLYFCTNEEVREYSEYLGFSVLYEPCPHSSNVFRRKIRRELIELEKEYPGVRLRLVKNFLKLLPKLSKDYGAGKAGEKNIGVCELCGEPSRNRVCRLCSLVNKR